MADAATVAVFAGEVVKARLGYPASESLFELRRGLEMLLLDDAGVRGWIEGGGRGCAEVW